MTCRWSSRAALALAATGVATGLVATSAFGTAPAAAEPSPADRIQRVATQVRNLEAEVRVASQAHEEAVAAVEAGEAELFEVEREVAATEARLQSSKRALGQLAAETYRTGTLDPGMLRVIFSDKPEDALHQAASYTRVLERQDEAVTRVSDVRAELAEDEAVLQEKVAELETNRELAERKRAEIQEKTASAKKLLATLREEERQRLAEEAARLAALREAERVSRSAGERESVSASRRPAASSAPSRAASSAPSRAASSAPSRAASTGSCPPSGSRGAETGLTPATLSIMRCGLAAFPQVDYAGGLGSRGNETDHDNGRAVDFMIPGYRSSAGNDLGWRVAEWATKQPGIKYVIFDQMIYGGWTGGWRQMENRGSDTANHRDHVHVSISG